MLKNKALNLSLFLVFFISLFWISCIHEKPIDLLLPWTSTNIQWQLEHIEELIHFYHEEGVILCKSSAGNPIGLEAETGQVKWKLNPNNRYTYGRLIFNEHHTPLPLFSIVVEYLNINSENRHKKILLDVSTGNILWSSAVQMSNLGSKPNKYEHEYAIDDIWFFFSLQDTPRLCAVELLSGEVIWDYPLLDAEILPTSWRRIHHVFISPLSIEHTTAYFTYSSTSIDGKKSVDPIIKCIAIDLVNGMPLWLKKLDGEYHSELFFEAPLIRSSTITIPFTNMMYGLNKTTGDIQWKYDGDFYKNQIFIYLMNMIPMNDDHILMYKHALGTDQKQQLYGLLLDASTGRPLWKEKWKVPLGEIYDDNSDVWRIRRRYPLLDLYNFRVSPLSSSNLLVHNEKELTNYSPTTGKRIWSYHIQDKDDSDLLQSDCAIADDLIFVSTAKEGRVIAIDLASGEEVWQYQDPGNTRTSPMQIENEMLVLGTQWGRIIALDPSNGEELWRLELNPQAKVISVHLATDHQILVIDQDHVLYMLSPFYK